MGRSDETSAHRNLNEKSIDGYARSAKQVWPCIGLSRDISDTQIKWKFLSSFSPFQHDPLSISVPKFESNIFLNAILTVVVVFAVLLNSLFDMIKSTNTFVSEFVHNM